MLNDVTACIVTRGDQPEMMERVRESLIFHDVIVWDNSQRENVRIYGRYMAAMEAKTPLVYVQDDDLIVPTESQWALLEAFEPGIPTCIYAHGETPAGYDDMPLPGAGAILPVDVVSVAFGRYLEHHPVDDPFLYYCDFACGVLYPMFKHVRLPFDIQMDVAQDDSRLCNQPWAAGFKATVTERARAIRDAA